MTSTVLVVHPNTHNMCTEHKIKDDNIDVLGVLGQNLVCYIVST